MIKIAITNAILNALLRIEANRTKLSGVHVPLALSNKLRKGSNKTSSSAATKIEGNPLSYEQAEEAIEAKRHLLSPEQEIKNYYLALNLIEGKLAQKGPISLKLILEIQALVVAGESQEKIGIRSPMPAGGLFAVYDDKSGNPDYIPPESKDILPLLNELVAYLITSDDHPLIKAAIAHYQLVTIHPFEDGNGRTARLLSDYVLSYYGYDFENLSSLEEYFAFDIDEYYRSLQMGLPALYYAKVVLSVSSEATKAGEASFSYLSAKEKDFLSYLFKNNIKIFKPIELAKPLQVSARTIANWSAALAKNGFLRPNLVKKRITSYSLTDLVLDVF